MNTLCQQYLTIAYHNTRGHRTHNSHMTIPETYGEILYPGMTKILAELSLHASDVFLDLGSGLGKIVLQVFLQTPVREAWGIEIIPELHQQAVSAAERVERELPDFYTDGRKLSFLCGDFFSTPLPSVSVVLISSPCFSPSMMQALESMINSMPSIHTVITLRPFLNPLRLRFKKAMRVECSWDSALCYIYLSD